jgi:hypothetical protein
MQPTRLLTVLFTLAVVLGLAATYAPEGMLRFYGDTTLTNLQTGAVYFNTSNSTFWAGGSTSNPVKVGDAAWSNLVSATGISTNLGFLDLSTNACTLYVTNGLIKGVTSP